MTTSRTIEQMIDALLAHGRRERAREALDAAVLANRASMTRATHDALIAAGEAYLAACYAVDADDYIERTV